MVLKETISVLPAGARSAPSMKRRGCRTLDCAGGMDALPWSLSPRPREEPAASGGPRFATASVHGREARSMIPDRIPPLRRDDVPYRAEHRRDQRADDEAVDAEHRHAAERRQQHDVVRHLGVLAD